MLSSCAVSLADEDVPESPSVAAVVALVLSLLLALDVLLALAGGHSCSVMAKDLLLDYFVHWQSQLFQGVVVVGKVKV